MEMVRATGSWATGGAAGARGGNVAARFAVAAAAALLMGASAAPEWCAVTVAGSGSGGDGGQALAAVLDRPGGVEWVAEEGALLMCEFYGHRVRRVDVRSGVITTAAGTGAAGFGGDGGPATAALLNIPVATQWLGSGAGFLVAEHTNHRVRRVWGDGTITTVAGTGAAGFTAGTGPALAASLHYPHGLLLLPGDGSVLVGDMVSVRRLWPDGTLSVVAGTGVRGFSGDGGLATAAQLSSVRGMVQRGDDLLLTDSDNRRIRSIAANGVITTWAGTGTASTTGDGGLASAAAINRPRVFAVDPVDGDALLVSELDGHVVRRIHADGTIATAFGAPAAPAPGDGGPAQLAKVAAPEGLAVDPASRTVFIAEGSHRVRAVFPSAAPEGDCTAAVTAITPAACTPSQQVLTLSGYNLVRPLAVTVDGQACTVTAVSADRTAATVTCPPLCAVGAVTVTASAPMLGTWNVAVEVTASGPATLAGSPWALCVPSEPEVCKGQAAAPHGDGKGNQA